MVSVVKPARINALCSQRLYSGSQLIRVDSTVAVEIVWQNHKVAVERARSLHGWWTFAIDDFNRSAHLLIV